MRVLYRYTEDYIAVQYPNRTDSNDDPVSIDNIFDVHHCDQYTVLLKLSRVGFIKI